MKPRQFDLKLFQLYIKRSFFLLFLYFTFLSSLSIAKQDDLRKLPYPYSHVICFASDIDMQFPWWGAAFHRQANEIFGLGISDSMWVHGVGDPNQSFLFCAPHKLNRLKTNVDNLPVFALLIRQWHRGNIDHFHSWQNDNIARLNETFQSAIPIKSGTTEVILSDAPTALLSGDYQCLRLYFTSSPSTNLSFDLEDSAGNIVHVLPAAIQRAKSKYINSPFAKDGNAIDLVVVNGFDEEIIFSSTQFGLSRLKKITFYNPEKESRAVVSLKNVQRDSFSRQTTLSQTQYLYSWNIRPRFLSGHGGFTNSANPGQPYPLVFERTPGSIWQEPNVDIHREVGGTDEQSHAFHGDVLNNLGLEVIWEAYSLTTMGNKIISPISETPSINLPTEKQFYSVSRTTPRRHILQRRRLTAGDCLSRERYLRLIKKLEPLMTDRNIFNAKDEQSIFKRENYSLLQAEQGYYLAMLIAFGLCRINAGLPVEHFWYTHFGTVAHLKELNLTYNNPLTHDLKRFFKELTNHCYNINADIPLQRRTWVPAASVYTHYKILQKELPEHVFVDNEKSLIQIKKWTSIVTKKEYPDLSNGTQDLHGATIYVKNAQNANVFVNDTAIDSFTRNPPDETGRESITLIDNSAPTVMLGKVSLKDRGKVTLNNICYNENFSTQLPSARDLTVKSAGDSFISFVPQKLDLWNTTHLKFTYEKRLVNNSKARFFVLLRMENDKIILIEEANNSKDQQTAITAPNADALYIIGNNATKGLHHTVAVDQFKFNMRGNKDQERLYPLPIGCVKEVQVGLKDASPQDQVIVKEIYALRPNLNGKNPNNEKLIMGRVMDRNLNPRSNVLVILTYSGGLEETMVTDSDGFYAFNVKKDNLIQISAAQNKKTFFPGQGSQLEILKDEAELDIIMDNE